MEYAKCIYCFLEPCKAPDFQLRFHFQLSLKLTLKIALPKIRNNNTQKKKNQTPNSICRTLIKWRAIFSHSYIIGFIIKKWSTKLKNGQRT